MVQAKTTDSTDLRILLRSSWQTVNIGDIGHTPGVLALLGKHLPNIEVRLWLCDVSNGVRKCCDDASRT